MNEMSHQDRADAHEEVCFVPREFEGHEIFYLVSRTGKRITLIAYVAAEGSYLGLWLIIPKKAFDNE
jgi:hypothetical protein